ncbi:rhombosortase [Shewanella schlegeliana]|uniref:Rhombosortase n=1 Tax=Shewanella schlegeliana TaxID=190308 RepID=A0ABS1SVU3_9GAMM|nr:rhombosortase [Shewanella schlegeliana]MBL4912034.1 rhombosortase [Shewanella schlegeliana]MCL1111590.1 rhombosortase [Shewanella schlegeliana]GIU35418.1 rhombosortase [Shewanella schlegeliana]
MLKLKLGVNSPYTFAFIITLVCICLFYLKLDQQLAYQRPLILDGQWWRLLSGNLLHTNAWHLYMNLAGFWVIVALHEQHYRAWGLGVLFLVLCLMQGIGLLVFYPSLIGYVGLSGMLHGLFTYGAVMDIRGGLKSGYLLLLGVILKVAYEQIFGASSEMTELIGARVATEAHLVGLVSGLICAGALIAFNHLVYKPHSLKSK